ncbi:MAG: holo-ACP synthase [Lachnospiraceae bacterium]|nr:holo-ACP synthase [Lachnospiraceae bacterium]MDE6699382.1 holo-ACP synthase [Lachnospiraceae bacterium]
MIVGIGTDIIEVCRIKRACEGKSFLMRYFTYKEIEFLKDNYIRIASNFAGKESVAKAFGTGVRGFELSEIEILRDEQGKPFVNLYGKAKEMAEKLGINNIHISISNLEEYATAFVVAETV